MEELVKQSLVELGDLVRCRCHPAYRDRGLHDPDCQCDSAEALQALDALGLRNPPPPATPTNRQPRDTSWHQRGEDCPH